MTNAEKYLKDGADVEKIIDELTDRICMWDFVRKENREIIANEILSFFEEKTKPILTEDERAILRHLKGFYYIYRASTGELEATNKEHTWCGYELYFDDDVFQFIKEGEEYSIKELLEEK